MKLLLPFILVFSCQSGIVSSYEVFDYISITMNEIKNQMTHVFHKVVDKFTTIMQQLMPENEDVSNTVRISRNSKTKIAFSDFVAAEAAQSETESPELFRLRSEPTALMSTPQLAALHGKRIESHVVVTEDGYFLTVHRLRNPLATNSKTTSKSINFTILMHHGLLGSSADWILLGPEKSLPYILSNAGCDVWLTNARGNYYSRGHSTFNVDTLEYWNFSFEQMGTHDLPAVIEYIRMNKNSTDKINFIGHSMGATAFLVMLSVRPYYNEYFRMGILMAPLVFMSKVKGPLTLLTSMTASHIMSKLLDEGEFMPNRKVPYWFAKKYCRGPSLFCFNPLLFLTNGSTPDESLWDDSLTARVLYHIPAGGSSYTIYHYAQMVRSGKFHKFNNELEEFDLKLVTVPIVLLSSSDDWLATKHDVLKLYFSIANPIDNYVIHGTKLTHTDFVFHPDADNIVFSKVVESLESDTYPKEFRSNEIMVRVE